MTSTFHDRVHGVVGNSLSIDAQGYIRMQIGPTACGSEGIEGFAHGSERAHFRIYSVVSVEFARTKSTLKEVYPILCGGGEVDSL